MRRNPFPPFCVPPIKFFPFALFPGLSITEVTGPLSLDFQDELPLSPYSGILLTSFLLSNSPPATRFSLAASAKDDAELTEKSEPPSFFETQPQSFATLVGTFSPFRSRFLLCQVTRDLRCDAANALKWEF